jgi:hypothetical protein
VIEDMGKSEPPVSGLEMRGAIQDPAAVLQPVGDLLDELIGGHTQGPESGDSGRGVAEKSGLGLMTNEAWLHTE